MCNVRQADPAVLLLSLLKERTTKLLLHVTILIQNSQGAQLVQEDRILGFMLSNQFDTRHCRRFQGNP